MEAQQQLKDWIDKHRIQIWNRVLDELLLRKEGDWESMGLCFHLREECMYLIGNNRDMGRVFYSIGPNALVEDYFTEMKQYRPANLEIGKDGYWWPVKDVDTRIGVVEEILDGLRNSKKIKEKEE